MGATTPSLDASNICDLGDPKNTKRYPRKWISKTTRRWLYIMVNVLSYLKYMKSTRAGIVRYQYRTAKNMYISYYTSTNKGNYSIDQPPSVFVYTHIIQALNRLHNQKIQSVRQAKLISVLCNKLLSIVTQPCF